MKLGKFLGLKPQVFHFQLDDKKQKFNSQDWSLDEPVTLISERHQYIIQQNDKIITVELKQKSTANLVHQLIGQDTLWALVSMKNNLLSLRYISFIQAPLLMELDIGVESLVAEQLFKENLISSETVNQAVDWLESEFIFKSKNDNNVIVPVYVGNNHGTLELLGQSWIATLKEQNNYWSVTRLTKSRKNSASLRILQGKIQFVNASVASQVESYTYRAALENSHQNHGNYIQLWRQYNDTEWKLNLTAARELGAVKFSKFSHGVNANTWIFEGDQTQVNFFEQQYQQVIGKHGKENITLEISEQLPDWLDNDQDVNSSGLAGKIGKPWIAEFVSTNCGTIILRYKGDRDQKPSCISGYIYLSMHGYRLNRTRRQEAIAQIESKTNPMPQLQSLLQGLPVPTERTKNYSPITREARKRFKGNPTDKQKEAIKVALRTPDIAIIIGPPGTGKTQVITALQVRLAEEHKDQAIQQQMLITSFQHDAVDNVMERSDVFGLPAIKIGGKQSKQTDAQRDPIDSWCSNRAHSLEQTLEELLIKEPAYQLIKKLQKQLTLLRVSKPSYQQKVFYIQSIKEYLAELETHQIYLSAEIEQRWLTWSKKFLMVTTGQSKTENSLNLLPFIRALRITPEAYEDDGAQQCLKLIDACRQQKFVLPIETYELLNQFSMKVTVDAESLALLKQIKNQLLDNLIPDYRPQHVQQMLSQEDAEILSELHKDIQSKLQQTHSLSYLNVLAEYHSALKHSQHTMRKAVLEYTSVLGATCQQAASNQMTAIQQVGFQNKINFDTVIIDEAARANPLDLMIPMAMARKRIVLVGDHRQLPHLLEPQVEEDVAKEFELTQVQREMFDQSLFERLINSLNELHKNHSQPKRVVMLDTQFRMHSVLGDFVSKQFYEKHGLDKVKSLLDDQEHFSHQVPTLAGKVCAWIQTPESAGKAKHRNGSRQREAEAKVIAKKAKEILEACPELSVGIITFYRAQVDCILDSMQEEGLTTNRQINPEWQTITKADGSKTERLRVGTVDAFQGKEFDVVLLSVVRTDVGELKTNAEGKYDEHTLNKAFGFLRLDNRLNVAMSRQHRLLIAVGDQQLAQNEATKTAVPALAAFYQLCKDENYGAIQ